MTANKLKTIIKEEFNVFFSNDYNGLNYIYENKEIEWFSGYETIKYKLNGLFPKEYGDSELINIKFLKGKKKRIWSDNNNFYRIKNSRRLFVKSNFKFKF